VYRYGGEELLIVFPEQELGRASAVAERLRGALADAAIPHAGNPPFDVLTACIGVAAAPPSTEVEVDAVLRAADAALYAAKTAGRNRVATSAADSVLA
jgi:diguanylate cyclase (GGDEF)-like protein